MDEPDDFTELCRVLEILKRAGWINGHRLDRSQIFWTPHGRDRAAQFLAISQELDLGAGNWVYLEVLAHMAAATPLDPPES